MARIFIIENPGGIDKHIEAYHANVVIGEPKCFVHFNVSSYVNGVKLNDTVQKHLVLEDVEAIEEQWAEDPENPEEEVLVQEAVPGKQDYTELITSVVTDEGGQFVEDYIRANIDQAQG